MSRLLPHATFAYYVPDPGRAADWYRDNLGFTIHADHRSDQGFRWVTASPPGADWHFAFSDVNVHGEGELAERFRSELGFAPHFMLVVEDLDSAVADLRERGVEIVEAPHDAPFGRAAAVRDLYGDVITVTDQAGWERFR
jgi:predicted enzyme related to lactoylglutathione lyase